ncbi:MAG: hypothetical protein IT463_06005 [Planctomycetes bacterium]|nr:hypothetical protein [Planctomycetota bacterium]
MSNDTLLQQLEDEARGRFVAWDANLWRELLAGPATALARALAEAGHTGEPAQAVFTSFLALLRDGIGMGYLVPASAGVQSFMGLAFSSLLPRLLPALEPARQAQALAECWNLGENLASQPAWMDRLICAAAGKLSGLHELEAMVQRVTRQVTTAPPEKLDRAWQPHMLNLGAVDARFLPGAVMFVAPCVAVVFDRARGNGANLGVWLGDDPQVIGPVPVTDAPPDPRNDVIWTDAAKRDRRLTTCYASARNKWRALCTLYSSQCVFALVPGSAS